jgi:hypothetical protein
MGVLWVVLPSTAFHAPQKYSSFPSVLLCTALALHATLTEKKQRMQLTLGKQNKGVALNPMLLSRVESNA